METPILKAGETMEVAGETYLIKSGTIGTSCSGCHFYEMEVCSHPNRTNSIGCARAKVIFTKPTVQEKIFIIAEQKAKQEANRHITRFSSAEEILSHLAEGLSILYTAEQLEYTLIKGELHYAKLTTENKEYKPSCLRVNQLLNTNMMIPYYKPEWFEVTPFKPRLCWVFYIDRNLTLLRWIKSVLTCDDIVTFSDEVGVPFGSDLFKVQPLTEEEIATLFIDNLEA